MWQRKQCKKVSQHSLVWSISNCVPFLQTTMQYCSHTISATCTHSIPQRCETALFYMVYDGSLVHPAEKVLWMWKMLILRLWPQHLKKCVSECLLSVSLSTNFVPVQISRLPFTICQCLYIIKMSCTYISNNLKIKDTSWEDFLNTAFNDFDLIFSFIVQWTGHEILRSLHGCIMRESVDMGIIYYEFQLFAHQLAAQWHTGRDPENPLASLTEMSVTIGMTIK